MKHRQLVNINHTKRWISGVWLQGDQCNPQNHAEKTKYNNKQVTEHKAFLFWAWSFLFQGRSLDAGESQACL
jgi:hypothetical protein